jgi:hypothetical protein
MREGAIRIEKAPPEAYYCKEHRAAHGEETAGGEKRSQIAFHRSLFTGKR